MQRALFEESVLPTWVSSHRPLSLGIMRAKSYRLALLLVEIRAQQELAMNERGEIGLPIDGLTYPAISA